MKTLQEMLDEVEDLSETMSNKAVLQSSKRQGFKFSEAARAKMSERKAGKALSKVTRGRMAKAKLGSTLTKTHQESLKASWTEERKQARAAQAAEHYRRQREMHAAEYEASLAKPIYTSAGALNIAALVKRDGHSSKMFRRWLAEREEK